MSRWSYVFIFLFSLLLLSGCSELGFDKDPNSDDSLEESDDLQKAYGTIEGVYEGSIELVDDGKFSNLPIEISLFTEISFEGRANGELVPQTTLVAIFKFLTISTAMNRFVYNGRYYYREDGRIQLAAIGTEVDETEGKFGANGIWFQAFMRGERIESGELHIDGFYGNFQARKVSGEVRVPAKGRSESDSRRFEEVFQPITGTYSGKFRPLSRRSPIGVQDAQFDFYVIDGELKGRLTGQGNQRGIRPLRVIEYRIDSGYIVLEGIPELAGTGGSVKGYGFFRATGVLNSGELRLEKAEDHRGLLGSFCGSKNGEDLDKVCPSPVP